MHRFRSLAAIALLLAGCRSARPHLTDYANPMLGTATLWDSVDLGFRPTRRTWGAETVPGASLPNAMVQATPVTQFHSGSGYQYEDSVIYGFAHTSKGHWNLCHIPLLPVAGEVTADDYRSPFRHEREEARPGYYRVRLDRYGIDAELTSTLRCAYHRYTYPEGTEKCLVANLARSNEHVRDWGIRAEGPCEFSGWQQTGERMCFYARSNHPVEGIDTLCGTDRPVVRIRFGRGTGPLELKIGFSFVSEANARENLDAEIGVKRFARVRSEADAAWEELLGRIRIEGGTERQRRLFYSSLYRSFLWPSLRSDVNGDYTDAAGRVANKGFRYYTDPSFWDDYRNKLVLLGLLAPDVTSDVIRSITDRGEIRGFMPTFFHGDHASVFVAGSYLRGIRGYDVRRAYDLLVRNATVDAPGGRRFLAEYIDKGYIAEQRIDDPVTQTVAKAAVTKTLEYAYDDYATALLARELGDTATFRTLMPRTRNYRHLFDPSTGLMRGRLADGEWLAPFRTEYPYYEYMYREANAWQGSFFAPHDPQGLIGLYESPEAFGALLDTLFTRPWPGYEVDNLSCFIGQYCHGNQPDHSTPYYYCFIGRQPDTQKILDHCLDRFYGMGPDGLALAGMDDAGEMSSWYVLNAMGLYTFSPADPEYLVTVPLFDRIDVSLGDGGRWSVRREGSGPRIARITCAGEPVDGWFVRHDALAAGELVVHAAAE